MEERFGLRPGAQCLWDRELRPVGGLIARKRCERQGRSQTTETLPVVDDRENQRALCRMELVDGARGVDLIKQCS